jgi:hypothetical protein
VVDDKPEEILKDGKVDPEERRELAVKHEWVPEWKYLVLYDVRPKNNKIPYYGKTGAQTEKGPGGELLPGGAEQVVFPPGKKDKTVSILKWGYVVEEDPKKKVKRIGAPNP